MKTMVSRTLSVHKEHELLLKLETAGLTEPLAQKVIDSKGNELAAKVVKFIQNGGFEPTTSQKRAREIMGKNMFGVEEAIQRFGVNPTRQQTLVLSEIPFSEEVLQKAKWIPSCSTTSRGITRTHSPRNAARQAGNWFAKHQWTIQPQRTGKSNWLLSQKRTKFRLPK